MEKKNKFLTLIFSCYPGGGHMYLGFMKQGIQLMLLFSIVAAISSFSYILNSLGFLIPIFIAYSIFDAMNKRSSMAEPDESDLDLFRWFNIENTGKLKSMNLYKIGVYMLIIVGVYILVDNVALNLLREFVYSRVDNERLGSYHMIERAIKSSILGIIFLVGGIKLRGKLKQTEAPIQIEASTQTK